MCVLGGPGLGKSESLKRTMLQCVGSHGWGLIKGKHTPLDLYERLYRFRSMRSSSTISTTCCASPTT